MKKGQFEMGFGMIFSIFLIIAFIAVAFIAIKAFLGVGCSTETGRFIQNLNLEVDRIWRGSGEVTTKEFQISNCNFEYVCFYDTQKNSNGNYEEFVSQFRVYTGEEGEHNLYFYPRKDSKIPSTRINHINMNSFNENPYCFKKIENKITIKFSKGTNEALVTLSN